MMLKILVAFWFAICTVLIFVLPISVKSEYDPDLELSQAIMSLEFEDELSVAVNRLLDKNLTLGYNQSSKNTVSGTNYGSKEHEGYLIHVVQGDCYCEWLSNRHQKKLNDWADDTNFLSVTVRINEFPFLRKFVPSTPAVIALDKFQQLIYMGPYSRGMGCYSVSGKVDKVLQQFVDTIRNEQRTNQKNQHLIQNSVGIIETDAKGCYCRT